MPAGLQIALSPFLLGLAALLAWLAGARGLRPGRALTAGAAWLALAALAGEWLVRPSPQELHGLPLGGAASFGLRLDAVSFAFALAVLAPAALLLTFQRRGWEQAGGAAMATGCALLAVLADGLIGTALCAGTAATLLLVMLRAGNQGPGGVYWPTFIAGWLCLVWAGAALQVAGGTAAYTAVPVTALRAPAFVLLALAALLMSGTLPWRAWTSEVWERPRITAGSLAAPLLAPVGLLLLVRAYAMGGGRWPGVWLNLLLAVAGAWAALAAATRAQQAPTRRACFGELLAGLAGFALAAVALGTPAGVVAGIAAVLALGLGGALLPLAPDDMSAPALAAVAVTAGLPPTFVFAARIQVIGSAIEAGDAWAFVGVVLAAGWLVTVAAAARALRLPAHGRSGMPGGSPSGALAVSAIALAAGVAYAAIVSRLAVPAASEVMPFPVGAVGGGWAAVVTASGAWAAVALGGPLAALLLAALPAVRAGWVAAVAELGAGRPPQPLFSLPWRGYPGALVDGLLRLRLPAQYETLLNPRAIEAAMARGQPVLWAVLLLVLAVAVNR